jgi:hypothetical protein
MALVLYLGETCHHKNFKKLLQIYCSYLALDSNGTKYNATNVRGAIKIFFTITRVLWIYSK